MYLFEIQTGWIGESYERCYVWAESTDQARHVFNLSYGPAREAKKIDCLFHKDDPPFITRLSGSGFTV
jgi:hypothetical protein